MPNFRYRALTQGGEIVNGSISAANAVEVAHRIEYLGLVPIDTVAEEAGGASVGFSLPSFNAPRPQDVTLFTRDLALLLKAGARLDDGLELLASDRDIGRLRPIVTKIRASVLAGESFAEAIAHHPALFPAIYVALVQVGETSGKLTNILEMLGAERARGEATRRKLSDALQYPAFILLAASCVLLFFILFVLPQFSAVLRDFNAKTDTVVGIFPAFPTSCARMGRNSSSVPRSRSAGAGWDCAGLACALQSPRKSRGCRASRRCSISIAQPCFAAISASCWEAT